jgi:hypothetical protein
MVATDPFTSYKTVSKLIKLKREKVRKVESEKFAVTKHFHSSTFSLLIFLREPGSGFCCLVTLLTKHCPSDLRLEGYLIMLAAIIADDLEPRRSIVSRDSFL